MSPSPERVPSQVRGAPAQRVAEERLTMARALRTNVFLSVSFHGRLEENVLREVRLDVLLIPG